jgi:hypothetical protein
MDDHRFHELARVLATVVPRRGFFAGVAGGAFVAIVGAGVEDIASKKRRKKKKKQSPCTPSCFNKVCGQDNGCGGLCTACPQGKTCQTNQCVDITCTPGCAGKNCGDSDGCGGGCTACPSGQSCQGSQCVADACDPPCRGAHFCQNGSCVCPPGMQSCDINFCGECCSDADCPFLNPYPIPPFFLCVYENDNTTHCECFPRPGEHCVQ